MCRALGVTDQVALEPALDNARPLTRDWLAPNRLASLLALQRSLRLASPGAVVQQRFAGYVATGAPKRLAGRLLFLEQAGRLPLLVASKQEWRQERGLPPRKRSPGEPPLISVGNVAILDDAGFAAAAGVGADDVRARHGAGGPGRQPALSTAAGKRRRAAGAAAARPRGGAPGGRAGAGWHGARWQLPAIAAAAEKVGSGAAAADNEGGETDAAAGG